MNLRLLWIFGHKSPIPGGIVQFSPDCVVGLIPSSQIFIGNLHEPVCRRTLVQDDRFLSDLIIPEFGEDVNPDPIVHNTE